MIPGNRGLGIGRPVKDDLSAFPSHVGRASVGAVHYFRTVAGIFARLQTLAGGATRHPAGRAIWSGSTFWIGEGLVRGPSACLGVTSPRSVLLVWFLPRRLA